MFTANSLCLTVIPVHKWLLFLRFLKVNFLLSPFEKLLHSLFYQSIYIKTFKQHTIMYRLWHFAIRWDRNHRRNNSIQFLTRYIFERKPIKFSRSDSRVWMWNFPDVLGTNSVPILRVCWPPASRLIFEISAFLTAGYRVKAKLNCSGFESQQNERSNSHASYFKSLLTYLLTYLLN